MRGRDFSKKGSIDELSILLRGEKKCFSHPLCTRERNDGKNNRKSVKNCWKSPLTFLIISRRDLISRRWMRLNFHYERSKAGTILNSLLKSSDKRCFIFILVSLFFSFPFSKNPTLNKRDKFETNFVFFPGWKTAGECREREIWPVILYSRND